MKLIHAFSLLQIFAYIYLCRPGADILPQATCLLYTSDAADDLTRVDLGGRRIIKKTASKRQWKNMKNHEKTDSKWSQNPLKIHQKIDAKKGWFQDWFSEFYRNFGVAILPYLPSVRKVNCRKTNKKEEKEKEKGTVQEKEHALPSLTRSRAAEQARGGSQLPAAIYPPRACKDRCMRKSAGGWMHVLISRFFADGFGEGVKN